MRILDRSSVKATSKREKTDDGYLIIKDCRLARTGVLYYHPTELGIIDSELDQIGVYRSPDELFKDSVISSFENKPITLTHPESFADSKNITDVMSGFARNVRKEVSPEGEFLVGDLIVMDSQAVDAIEKGVEEISLGYDATLSPESGEYKGNKYNYVFSDTKGNHVAIVAKGRCGSLCRVSDELNEGDNNMSAKLKVCIVDGVTYEFEDQAASVVMKLNDSVSALKAKLKDAEAAKEKAEKEKEEAEADKEKAEGEMEDMKKTVESMDSLVDEKVKTVEKAKAFFSDFDGAGLSSSEIRKKVCQDLKVVDADSNESDDFIKGVFSQLKPINDSKNVFKGAHGAEVVEMTDADIIAEARNRNKTGA